MLRGFGAPVAKSALLLSVSVQPPLFLIVDAGVGTASDATIAMELGADAVLMNTAIAEAEDSAKMAEAMKLAIGTGRLAYLSGRMTRRLYASASSPTTNMIR